MNIKVTTANADGCGSNSDIRIELTQGYQSCRTGSQGISYRGASLEWGGNGMGACQSKKFTINKPINFKFVMNSGEEVWCPLRFTAHFERGVVYNKNVGGFVGSKFTGKLTI